MRVGRCTRRLADGVNEPWSGCPTLRAWSRCLRRLSGMQLPLPLAHSLAGGQVKPNARSTSSTSSTVGPSLIVSRWLLSSRPHGGALGKRDQLVHGPLVIGMGPVFRRFDLAGRRDQKVAREQIGLSEVNLLGQYNSCPHVLVYAARHPEKVARLVLFGGSARGWTAMSSAPIQALLTLIEVDWNLFADTAAHQWLGWSAGEAGRATAETFRGAVRSAWRQIAHTGLYHWRSSFVRLRPPRPATGSSRGRRFLPRTSKAARRPTPVSPPSSPSSQRNGELVRLS